MFIRGSIRATISTPVTRAPFKFFLRFEFLARSVPSGGRRGVLTQHGPDGRQYVFHTERMIVKASGVSAGSLLGFMKFTSNPQLRLGAL